VSFVADSLELTVSAKFRIVHLPHLMHCLIAGTCSRIYGTDSGMVIDEVAVPLDAVTET
jgi:hypothetical protein